MFALIIWFHIGTSYTMTVVPVLPESCGTMRAAMVEIPSVTHAMCAGTPAVTIGKALVAGDCISSGNGADFYCARGYAKF
jgi:hypothetical protein